MKKAYRKPKAMVVDFCYDEQVTASSGSTSPHGDPFNIGRCQQSNAASCVVFWSTANQPCKMDPYSKPGGNPVAD